MIQRLIPMKANIKKAEKLAGKKIQNKFGSCFDSAAHQSMAFNERDELSDLTICHGIGVANMPGEEGCIIGHAWLEMSLVNEERRAAYDPIWNVFNPSAKFRDEFKLNYVVEYPYQDFIQKWTEEGFSGPWDKKIKLITDQVDYPDE